MKNIIIIGLKLMAICAVSALVLSLVNGVTAPKIAELKKGAEKDALMVVVSEGVPGDEVAVDNDPSISSYIPVTSDNGATISYVVKLIGAGYAGDMVILANYNVNGSVLSSILLDNLETPGLGKEAEKPEYMEKFKGTGGEGEKPVPQKRADLDTADADTIGGVTVTFVGIANALADGSNFVKEMGK